MEACPTCGHKEPEKCGFCGKKMGGTYGWSGLCNRTCYYGISELLEYYDTHDVQPDPRLEKYFSKYSPQTHSFVCSKNPKWDTSSSLK